MLKLNLNEILDASVAVFDVQQGLEIRYTRSSEPVWIMGNKDQCLRILNNLLKNAVQATDEVTNPTITITVELNDDEIKVAVQDNGIGISDTLKEKMFTPNFTTKSTGSGLGLAMVKNIVDGLGGKIWFENNEGRGVTFFVTFRRAA